MANITRRRTGELLQNLFDVLKGQPFGLPAREALVQLEKRLGKLTDYEAGSYDSGGRRFEKIVRFATVDCVKAGWLQKNKGIWTLTAEGLAARAEFSDAEAFYKRAVQLYKQWEASQPDAEPESVEEADAAASGKAARITFEEAEEQSWAEIEHYLRSMNPYDFQDLVADLLRAMEYHVSWVSPPGKDGGLDILAWTDPLGTRPPRIKVQVKRVVQPVSVEGLRSFMALLEEDDVGIFVSLGGFTKDAQDTARTQAKRKVTLIDLERLFDLWVENYKRLSDDARRRLPLRPIFFLSPLT